MKRVLLYLIAVLPLWHLLSFPAITFAENINPYNDDSQYAWGENIGWLNFEPSQGPGVHVSSSELTGYIWAENIGWINLSPSVYGGVTNDGIGNLSGYAWGENVGWINFDPTYGGVSIDSEGNFDGWAWGENIGWIHFQSNAPVAYKVKVCMVTLEDLANFVADWLQGGAVPGNLDGQNNVNLADFSIFASYWFSYCPDDWQL